MISSYSHAIKIWFLNFPLQCLAAALDGAKGPIFGHRRASTSEILKYLRQKSDVRIVTKHLM